MTYMLTIKDLENRPEGAYYTGPLDVAKDFIRETYIVSVVSRVTSYTVFISPTGTEIPDWDNVLDYGNGSTEEVAWRWALGAAFGPADDEFSAFPLTHNKTVAVRVMVGHHFPNATDIFYSVHTAHAAVLDEDGNMWQVFPDGTIKVYRG